MEQPLIDFNFYPVRLSLKSLLKDKSTKKILYGLPILMSTWEIVLMIGLKSGKLLLLMDLF